MKARKEPVSSETYFVAGTLALAYFLPQATAESWSLKWPVMAGLFGIGAVFRLPTAFSRRTEPAAAWIFLAVWLAAIATWSYHPQRSLIQTLFCVWACMIVFLGKNRLSPAAIGTCIIAAGAIELLVQGWQLAAQPLSLSAQELPRLFGSFVNANHHAALLFSAYAVAGVRATCGRGSLSILFLAGALVFLAGAELSRSRALLVAAPAFISILWVARPDGFCRKRYFWLAGLTTVLLFSPTGPLSRVAEQAARTDDFALKRIQIWEAALRIVRSKPIIGVGLGAFGDAFLGVRTPDLAVYNAEFAHCEPLQFACETGIVGLGLSAWLAVIVVALIRRNFRADGSRAGPTFAAYSLAIFSLFGFPFHVPVLAVIMILCLASSTGRTIPEGKPVAASVRAALYIVAVLMIGWIAACAGSEYMYARGAKSARSGRHADSRAFLERSARLCPMNAEAIVGLAEISGERIDERCRAARKLRPAWVPPLSLLFDSALADARSKDAAAALKEAQDIDPYGFDTSLMAARLDIARGRLDDARMQLARMEQTWRGNIGILLARAELKAKSGDTAAARSIIRRVLSLYPMNEGARRILARIE